MSELSCLFHIPYIIDPERNPSAPQIRPTMLRGAFEELGIDVYEISGSSSQRKAKINSAVKELREGKRFDFLYSECATIPTLLTDPDHFPHGGLADFRLFKECHAFGIPSGLFYRDIYWMFPDFDRQYGAIKAWLMKILYKYDLHAYSKYIDALFVPSEGFGSFMVSKVGIDLPTLSCLPPGCMVGHNLARAGSGLDGQLNILYVGGISGKGMYDMRELFSAVGSLDFARLVVCVREREWDSVKSYYEDYLAPNIEIVHKSGDDLKELYEWADLGALLFHPNAYRSFAMPFKVFEYLGMCLPMIASARTSVASLVKENGWGWDCDFNASSISLLLIKLQRDKSLLRMAARRCLDDRERNTWKARAVHVCAQLGVGNVC